MYEAAYLNNIRLQFILVVLVNRIDKYTKSYLVYMVKLYKTKKDKTELHIDKSKFTLDIDNCTSILCVPYTPHINTAHSSFTLTYLQYMKWYFVALNIQTWHKLHHCTVHTPLNKFTQIWSWYTSYPKSISAVKKARPRKCKLLRDLKMWYHCEAKKKSYTS